MKSITLQNNMHIVMAAACRLPRPPPPWCARRGAGHRGSGPHGPLCGSQSQHRGGCRRPLRSDPQRRRAGLPRRGFRELAQSPRANACVDQGHCAEREAREQSRLTSESATPHGARAEAGQRRRSALMPRRRVALVTGSCDAGRPARIAGRRAGIVRMREFGCGLYSANSSRSRSLFIDSIADEGAALSSAWRMQRTGNFVAAFDLAQEALRRWPGSQALQHLSILALASCGSTAAALDAFRSTSLRANANEDFLALEARLLKDLAFQDETHPEASLMQAAEAYERRAARPMEPTAARMRRCSGCSPETPQRAFAWPAAWPERVTGVQRSGRGAGSGLFSLGDARGGCVGAGRPSMLERAVPRANPLCRQNSWARSSTFLQMRRLSGLRPDCADAVEAWHRPPVSLVLNPAWLSPGPQSAPDWMPATSRRSPIASAPTGEAAGRRWPREGFSCTSSSPTRRATSPMSRAAPFGSRHDASGHCDAYTWSSLLLDESDDRDRVCAEAALGLSLGHADALCAPWVVLARADGRWPHPPGRRPFVDLFRHRLAGEPSRSSLTIWISIRGCRQLFVVECRRYAPVLDRPAAEDRGGGAASTRGVDRPAQDLGGRRARGFSHGDRGGVGGARNAGGDGADCRRNSSRAAA